MKITQSEKYYEGCTFYVLFSSGRSKHERLSFINEGTEDKKLFFNWLCDKRIEIEKEIGESVFIENCKNIRPK